MLPNPLHPAVVHFPIVLVVVLPLFAAGALWVIRRGGHPLRSWAIPVALSAALTLSAYLALQTGEADEERVEAVVSEAAIHQHEEAAERFLVLTGVLLLIAGAGLLPGHAGRAARLITVVGSLGVLAAGVQVGAAGGELVYRQNAASVYADNLRAEGTAGSAEVDDD
jgi:uncharacterized membrane protein